MDWTFIITIIGKIFLVLFLVFLNGFFVAAEFAIVKIRETQLNPLIQAGQRRAKIARHIVSHLDAFLSASQLGITLASLGLGWVGEPVFASLLEPAMIWFNIESEEARHSISFIVGFSAITFLHITVGELAPKSMAIQKPLQMTLLVSYPMLWFYHASYPFIYVLNGTSLWMLRRLGIQPATESEIVHSEEELRLLFSMTHKHSAGTAIGRDIVLNALDLRQRLARDVMRPRQEITGLDTEAPINVCLEIAEKTRFSRFPLCKDGNLDQTLGVVHFKDLFAMRHTAKTAKDLIPVARKLIYVPETSRLETLLQLFLDRRVHFALVVDEFGGTAGLVTLENILEELVGQIQDEFDQETPQTVEMGKDSWEILGTLPLHELEEMVGQSLQEEGLTTTSGWITHRLGGFPKVGDTIRVGDFEMKVQEMEERKVGKLILRRYKKKADPQQ